jgi:hypothetical protein
VRRAAPLAPSSLTSLVDVLFILVFAALVQRAATVERQPEAKGKPDEPAVAVAPAWQPPPQVEALRQAAISTLASELQQRPAIIARVSGRGVLRALEIPQEGQAVILVELPLIEPVSDPDVGIGYVGERETSRRICAVAAARVGAARPASAAGAASALEGMLVVISVDAPLAELTVALVTGLRRDVEHCLSAHRAAAVLLDPEATAKLVAPATRPTPATPVTSVTPVTPGSVEGAGLQPDDHDGGMR